MSKLLLDTNIMYALIDESKTRCDFERLRAIVFENDCVISYGTLFEIFDFKKSDYTYLKKVLELIDKNKIGVYANFEKERPLFWELVYSKKILSDSQIASLKGELTEQVKKYVCKTTSVFIHAFAILYMNLKLNEKHDTYNEYILFSDYVTNGFDHFQNIVKEQLEYLFEESYLGDKRKKFSNIIQEAFKNVIIQIETIYTLLASKGVEAVNDLGLDDKVEHEIILAIENNKTKNYIDYIKSSIDDLKVERKCLKRWMIYS